MQYSGASKSTYAYEIIKPILVGFHLFSLLD